MQEIRILFYIAVRLDCGWLSGVPKDDFRKKTSLGMKAVRNWDSELLVHPQANSLS